MPATFDGVPLFGAGVRSETQDAPRDVQINSFFGVDGVERLDGGSRGRLTVVTGTLAGAGVAGLAGAFELLGSYRDGREYELVDTKGRLWTHVVLESVRETGPVRRTPDGTAFQTYEARFMHLA